MNFKEYYSQFGIEEYPFNTFSTEQEKNADKLFIEPVDYDVISDAFKDGKTILLYGNRGTGKTAMVNNLVKIADKDDLTCYIDDYSSVGENGDLLEFYTLIIEALISQIYERVTISPKSMASLSRNDKIFLSYLTSKYTSDVTVDRIREKIENIQLSWFKRVINKCSAFITLIANYGLTVATRTINEAITKNFPGVVMNLDEEEIRKILPDIGFSTETDFNDLAVNLDLIKKISILSKKIGVKKCIVIMDKIDEDPRFQNDAEAIATFISPVLTDNRLLLNGYVQIVVSMWTIPFSQLKSKVRTQKYCCQAMTWKKNDLIRAFNKRMEVYSSKSARTFDEMFASTVSSKTIDKIIELSNGNPRDLWHIFNALFRVQFEEDSSVTVFDESIIEKSLKNYVSLFNYYEYYPRKKNSRANKMDVYSYIDKLLKMGDTKFTANKLNRSGVGSSANAYIGQMNAMGLTEKTAERIAGGTVYKINDPKVEYAIENGISIRNTAKCS